MKLRALAVLTLVLTLTGCCTVFCPPPNPNDPQRAASREANGFDGSLVQQANPNQPNVSVTEDGQITVDQEPIRVRGQAEGAGRSSVKIVWAVERGNAFTFAPDTGIAFRPTSPNAPAPRCARQANGKVFACTIEGRAGQSASYKYTVNLIGPKGTVSFDPNVEVNF